MTVQTGCVKCGELGVRRRSAIVDRRSGKPVGWMRNLVLGGIITLLGALFVWVSVGMARALGTVWIFVGYSVCLTGPALTLGLQLVIRYLAADKTVLFKYRCTACNHRWEQWEEGWDSVACGECGESTVTTYEIPVSPLTQRPQSLILSVYGGVFLVLIGVAVVVEIVPVWLETGLIEGLGIKVIWSLVALAFIVGGPAVALSYFLLGKDKLLKHRCATCGHSWEHTESKDESSTSSNAASTSEQIGK